MHNVTPYTVDSKWIVSQRGEKNYVDPLKPYAFFTEKERMVTGKVDPVATIFLTNRECPFKCLMCDLWKNTTDKPVPEGAIPAQITYALSALPETKHLKLYNSGSFFDTHAIPPTDYTDIARQVSHFDTVIVESHPVFINENVLRFRDLIRTDLQVAIGLETIHPEVLPMLNKHMSLTSFKRAVAFLRENHIGVRAFILLRPPFLSEEEGITWAKRSIEFAFNAGVQTCTVIPVRKGNGALDVLAHEGHFASPSIESLEEVLAFGIGLQAGNVFADIWDLEEFTHCLKCLPRRKERLHQMNLTQQVSPEISCSCNEY